MNEQKIHEQLQRYFDGATSLKEEYDLRCYFSGDNIHESLAVYRPLFDFIAEERSIEPPQQGDSSPCHQEPLYRNKRLPLYILAGIAASIAILFIVGMPKNQTDDYVYYVNGQRIYDETAALEMAENKLQLLAVSMQKAQTGMSTFDKLQETGESLQQFSKISDVLKRFDFY